MIFETEFPKERVGAGVRNKGECKNGKGGNNERGVGNRKNWGEWRGWGREKGKEVSVWARLQYVNNRKTAQFLAHTVLQVSCV